MRGAALLGGAVLALAAILFFHHAFTNNYIRPPLRVVLGIVAGLGFVVAGGLVRRRGYGWVPSALEGAGIVTLYATIYYADRVASLWSTALSFPAMAVVTALACVLAVRYRSLFTAVLGLVGGFATPLLLSADLDRPLSLFGYILLLDLGLVFVGHKRRWPSVGVLALVGTFLFEGLWIFGERGMAADQILLGLSILAVFAALFAVSGGLVPVGERRKWLPSQAGAVLFPFVFALYFAGAIDFRGHVWPIALLLGLLTVGGIVVGRLQRVPWLPIGAASACVAVVGVWVFQGDLATPEKVWELAVVVVGLALIPHLAAEWERRRASGGDTEPLLAHSAAGVTCGWTFLAVVAAGHVEAPGLAPLLAPLVALAALLGRQAWLTGRAAFVGVGTVGLAFGLTVYRASKIGFGDSSPNLDARLYLAVLVVIALAYVVAGFVLRGVRGRAALHGVGVFLLIHALDLQSTEFYHPHDPWLLPCLILAFAALALVATTRLGWSTWFVVAVAASTWLTWGWQLRFTDPPRGEADLLTALVLLLGTAALYVFWPPLLLARFRELALSWRAAPLVGRLRLPPRAAQYDDRVGGGRPGLPPLVLGVLVLGAIAIAAARWSDGEGAARRPALAWYGASGLALLAIAVAGQVGEAEMVVTLALWAAGLAWLARRLLHPGLAWIAAPVTGVAVALLCAFGLVPEWYARSDVPLWSWMGYAHLVPAACAIAVLRLQRDVPHYEGTERGLRLARGLLPGVAAMAALFLWLNLEILNHFSTGERLAFDMERMPARDVTMSIAWGVYALALLVLGTIRRTSALRWASLAVFFLSIGKVFLYDLGHLEGLYRVGSLAGLAAALILVSLLYQRFVFRKPRKEGGRSPAP